MNAGLGTDECWTLLGPGGAGRVCFCVDEVVGVTPVPYVVGDGVVFCRVSPFGIVARHARRHPVTFQADDGEGQHPATWSVTLSAVSVPVTDQATIASLWAPGRVVEPGRPSSWIALAGDAVAGHRLVG